MQLMRSNSVRNERTAECSMQNAQCNLLMTLQAVTTSPRRGPQDGTSRMDSYQQ